MKKVLSSMLVCVFSFIYFSCSSEDEVILQDKSEESAFVTKSLSTIDFEKAKQMYIDMMATQEYSDCKTAVLNFNTKLRVHNVSFNNKKDWMDWANINISNTNFSNINEFETYYDNMVSKTGVMIAANATLYNFMGNSTRSQLIQILEPEQPVYPPVQQQNCETCYTVCEIEMDIAYENRIYATSYALLSYAAWGDIDEDMANIWQTYWDAMLVAEINLNNCLGTC